MAVTIRLTVHDLMVIAGVEGQPLSALRLGEWEPPYSPDDIIIAEPGEQYRLRYDDGRQERTVVVTI